MTLIILAIKKEVLLWPPNLANVLAIIIFNQDRNVSMVWASTR